jgi:stalled ribosome rescue protein Dom34
MSPEMGLECLNTGNASQREERIEMARRRRGYRRGYPVAVLIGFDNDRTVLWRVFSQVVKPHSTIQTPRGGKRELYNFHEAVVDALRPILKEGVGSVIIAAPARTSHVKKFLDHVAKHQPWMTKGSGSATFTGIVGAATNLDEVSLLVRSGEVQRAIGTSAAGEADRIKSLLESRLAQDNASPILYSLYEIEEMIFEQRILGKPEPEHLILTDKFLTAHRRRAQRLMDATRVRGVRAYVVGVKTAAGQRVEQLGGMVLLTKLEVDR